MKEKKNIAVIGVGRWGKNLLREFNKIARIDFYFHKGNPETAKWLKLNYLNIKTTRSFQELLANPIIDAIVIATPIKTHYKLARQALLAGKHVFVEKPMVETVSQAKELVRLAAKKNLILFVGYTFLYHPIFKKMQEIIKKEGAEYIKMLWEKFGFFHEKIELNLLPHELSIMFGLFGQPQKIKITGRCRALTETDIIVLRAKYQKLIIDIEINRISNQKRKAITFITKKTVYVWENDQLFKLDKKTTNLKLIYQNSKTPLEIECREFLKSLNTKKPAYTNGVLGLAVNELLAKI